MRRPLLPLALACSLAAALVPVVTETAPARAAAPSYSLIDLGRQDDVGRPIAIDGTGDVATEDGVWHSGTFTPVPTLYGPARVTDMDAGGLVLAQSQTHLFWWSWQTSSTTDYPRPAETKLSNGTGCGGGEHYTLDSAAETGGYIQYVTHPDDTQCVQGHTTQVGSYIPAPGGADEHLTDLYQVYALTPHYALGIENGDEATTVVDRVHSTKVTVPTVSGGVQRNHALAADGAFVGIRNDLAPAYVSPTGTVSSLSTTGLTGSVNAWAMNDSHMVAGDSAQGALLWQTPTSAPLQLTTLAPTGAQLDTATVIGPRGDVAGLGARGDDSGYEHTYVLSVGTSLSASIALTNPDGSTFSGSGTRVGDTLKATVTLANSSLSQPITGVTVDPSMAVSPSGLLQLTGGPSTEGPVTIAPSGTVQYVLTYTVTALGRATLSLSASGTQNGQTASADASTTTRLGQALRVDVAFKDSAGNPVPSNHLTMTDLDDGEVPVDLSAVVTITNVSSVQQDSVAFNGGLIPSFHTSTNHVGVVPLTITSGPTGDAMSSLAVGAHYTETYGLHLTDNGVFDLSSQVTSADHGVEGPTNVSGGVGTLTADPTALLVLKLHAVTDLSQPIKAGLPVLVSGTLVNRSNTHVVDVAPLVPTVDGNAGEGYLYDASQGALPDGIELPVFGKLQPAAKVDVEGEIDTAPVPGTRATLTYAPTGKVVNDDGTETALTATQVRVAAGSSPVQITMDTAGPPKAKVNAATVIGAYGAGQLEVAAQWSFGGFLAALDVLQHPVTSSFHLGQKIPGFVVATKQAADEAASALSSIIVYAQYYDALTPGERAEFADQITDDFEHTSLAQGRDAVRNAVDPFLQSFETALQTEDWNKVANLTGKGLATGGTLVADQILTEIAFAKLGLAAKAKGLTVAESPVARTITLEEAAQKLNIPLKAGPGKSIKGIARGQNLLLEGGKALIEHYGLSADQVKALVKYCEDNGVTIALRSRSQKARDLIAKGYAVGKNLVIKLKNVDQIDVDFLGYLPEDQNTVVWAKPITEAQFKTNLAEYGRRHQLTKEIRYLAEKRYATRVKEWNNLKYEHEIKEWARSGKIELRFDGETSGVGHLDKARMQTRRFKLDSTTVQRREYHRLKVAESTKPGARLIAVSQDVDTVAVLGGNMSILPPALRAQVYEYLEDVLGIQHPDTVPWIQTGEIGTEAVAFKAKVELLLDHLPGGEPLAVFGPNGSVRAAYFDPARVVFDTVTKGGSIFLDGAFLDSSAPVAIGALAKLL